MVQEDPNMLWTLTWCHRTPADTPTRPCSNAIRTEQQHDNVARACYPGRKVGPDTLTSNNDPVVGGDGATAILHQGCAVSVHDFQVVVVTGGMGFDVK